MESKEEDRRRGGHQELRREISLVLDQHQGDGNREDLLSDLVAVFERSTARDPLNSALAAGLEALSVKADAQVEYWRNKQNEYPALDEFLDEDGILDLPEDISPILSQASANGSYSEADWWRSTIRGFIAAVNETSVARGPLPRLQTFANEIIDLAAEDDAPDGGSIHRRAVELGLLHENKSVTATGGVVDYRRDDVLHTCGSVYFADVDPSLVVGIDRIRDAISSLEASGGGWLSQDWDVDPREGAGEPLVFRKPDANMFPFSSPVAVCRAPKLAEWKQWEAMANYLASLSPCAVSGLMRVYDGLVEAGGKTADARAVGRQGDAAG